MRGDLARLGAAGFAIVWLPIGAALYVLERTEAGVDRSRPASLVRPIALWLIAGLAWRPFLS